MSAYDENIEVQGARVHNLKNIDVTIPREKLVVITGLSGISRKSFYIPALSFSINSVKSE